MLPFEEGPVATCNLCNKERSTIKVELPQQVYTQRCPLAQGK